MSYSSGNYSNDIAIANYPMLTMPTTAMRTYAISAPPGNVGQNISGGLERGSGFVCCRVGKKRSLMLASRGLNLRGYHLT